MNELKRKREEYLELERIHNPWHRLPFESRNDSLIRIFEKCNHDMDKIKIRLPKMIKDFKEELLTEECFEDIRSKVTFHGTQLWPSNNKCCFLYNDGNCNLSSPHSIRDTTFLHLCCFCMETTQGGWPHPMTKCSILSAMDEADEPKREKAAQEKQQQQQQQKPFLEAHRSASA